MQLKAATVLPSGGTYNDTMGLDQPSTITQMVKAKVEAIVAPQESNSCLTTKMATLADVLMFGSAVLQRMNGKTPQWGCNHDKPGKAYNSVLLTNYYIFGCWRKKPFLISNLN
jgi:hypothetical protein